MLISTPGHDANNAAAKRDVAMVFPKRLGVEIRTSCGKVLKLYVSRILRWFLSNVPGGSSLKNTRTVLLKNAS